MSEKNIFQDFIDEADKRGLEAIWDDLERDTRTFIRKIFEFLDVDASFAPPSVQRKINTMPFEMREKADVMREKSRSGGLRYPLVFQIPL